MAPEMTENSSQTNRLLRRAAGGDPEGWAALLAQHQDRLRRMVALRLDRRLQGRVDPSDVLQEAYLEAAAHLADYLRQPDTPFFLWLRAIAGHKLLALHRQHLGTQMRAAGREVSLHRGSLPGASPWVAVRTGSGVQQGAPARSRQPKSLASATCTSRQPRGRSPATLPPST